MTLSAPSTSNHGTAIETTVVNPDLAPGEAVRVEYMHNGFDAVVTRWVRDADGNLIHEDVWYSHYRTVNGITEVGPPPPALSPYLPTPPPLPPPAPPEDPRSRLRAVDWPILVRRAALT